MTNEKKRIENRFSGQRLLDRPANHGIIVLITINNFAERQSTLLKLSPTSSTSSNFKTLAGNSSGPVASQLLSWLGYSGRVPGNVGLSDQTAWPIQ
jgi:hypothetical protein